jgi:DNA-binding LacI/PurR family transcriptional regulator
MVNIKDIAKYCGVSAMTVSRALNNSSEISESTKEKVLKACQELGYKPNSAAKSLITKKTNMIGLIIPDITNQYYSHISKGVGSYLEEQGYGLILCNSDRKKENENRYLSFLTEGRVDGIIILPVKPHKEDYEAIAKELPMVMVDNIAKDLEVSFIGNNNYDGGTKIISHMVKQGYKKIGVILGDKRSTASNERFAAYKDVLASSGIKIDESIIHHSNSTFEDGFKLAELLIDNGVDSIFAINDTVAMGVLKYCYKNNISVPEKLGVAGYDNIEQSAMMPVPLTTVEQNKDILGKIAAEVLMEHVKDNSAKAKDIILEPKLVIRKSCGEK